MSNEKNDPTKREYQILRTLRRAIFGKVVQAVSNEGNIVAIKVMKKKCVEQRRRARGGGRVKEDAESEIKILR
jgi:hypothetical protein